LTKNLQRDILELENITTVMLLKQTRFAKEKPVESFKVMEIKKGIFENNDRQADTLREDLTEAKTHFC
jgi:hypothetical protein